MKEQATITLTAQAHWRLQWLCHRSANEVSAMGLLAKDNQGILIEDFILVRQAVGPAQVSLDMEDWADKVAALFGSRGIEPWQLSVWAHTHPAGLNRPSSVDEATMAASFGDWDLAIMLIMTRDGQFYARMEVDHDFGQAGSQRLSIPCKVAIDWTEAGGNAVTPELMADWEAEYRECVTEAQEDWLFDGEFRKGPDRHSRRPGKQDHVWPLNTNLINQKEVEEYAQICQCQGLDPDDPANFEDYFGFDAESDVIFED